jgi:hypothetical protein
LKNRISFFFLLIPFVYLSQNDTLPYSLYKDKIVLYSDLGYTSAPFSMHYNFNSSIDKIKYKNNFRTILGLGVSYKWFALRIGIPLPGNFKPVSRYGKTIPFDFGFDFTIKRTFFDVDLRSYKGYAVLNADKWNDTLNNLNPNDIRPDVNTVSFSTNVWYFHDKHFKMSCLKGKTGHYDREVKTWYIKNSLNIFGVGNGNLSIIPKELIDTTNTKTSANIISSFDIGIIPGYAYVNKINNWQFSALGGMGVALQGKFYAVNETARGFLGLAPRFDIRLIGGYSVPRYFIFLVTDFDNKSIRFNDLIYRQTFYTVKIVGGIRLDNKSQNKKIII